MNLTLLSFISLNQALNSPFLILQNGNRLTMQSCCYFKHIQSIIFNIIHNDRSFLNVLNTKFDSIFNSAIYISKEKQYNLKTRMLLDDSSKYILSNLKFINCNGFRGGAIHSEATHLIIMNCIFMSNRGNYGAAVYAGNILKGKITDSLFKENFARNLCAGYFLDSDIDAISNINIQSNNFTNQKAACVGAIECWGGIPRISFCYIDHCISTFGQPAVRTSTIGSEKTQRYSILDFVTFINCTSRQYGSVFQSFVYKSSAYLKNCLMINNRCDSPSNGTTIFIQNTEVNIILQNCIIYGKKEKQFGGVKKMKEIVLKNVTFIDDEHND